jgi:PAS domain S-box-containing protein
MMDTIEQRPLANILVVEDDEAQRHTVCDILRQEGFEPIACADASEALESAQTSNASVAIVDLRLPDMSGIQVLQELMTMLQGARVIIHTAFGSFESARDALNLGAFAYVEKLSDPRELISHVHRAMDELLAQALRKGGEDLATLTRYVPDVVFQVDRRGNILFVNRPIPGYAVEDLIGEQLREWIVPDHQAIIDASLREVFETYRPQECDLMTEGRDGSRYWYSCRIGPIGSPGHVERAIIIARDITEDRQAEQIERVMLQLFRNAREATTGGGHLTIDIGTVMLDEDYVQSQAGARQGPHVRIAVQDTGRGIPEEYLDRIFEPFFTTKPGKSKGLGLTEVYGIVAQAGGHLSVESEPTKGSTFSAYLPTSLGSDLQSATPEPPDDDGPNRVYRFPQKDDA